MPKVSVIIPNYNHSIYLEKRIDSVLSQTYRDFEVIILDDLSTDNSRDIIERYRESSKISRIVYNDENSGSTFKQWDKGIHYCQGEYIWIAESDDWCETNLLEMLVSGMELDKSCVISYCQSYCVEGKNKVRYTSTHTFLSEIIDGKKFIKEYLSFGLAIFNASMAIWRKSAYEKISRDYLGYKLSGDWLFWIEMSSLGRVHISGRVLNYFRKHENDVSGEVYRTGKNFLEELNIVKTLVRYCYIDERQYFKVIRQLLKRYYKKRKMISLEIRSEIERKLYEVKDLDLRTYWLIKQNQVRYYVKYFLKK